MSNTRKFFDSATWFIFFGSIILSILTVVAQNTLPGDLLYGFKLGYEKVVMASSRFLNKQVDLQIEYVGRRFSEATKVLASKEGRESLDRLNTEVESTAYTITMLEDPEEKQQAAEKYITQLNAISSGLGEQKQNFIKNSVSSTGTISANPSNPTSDIVTTSNDYNPPATNDNVTSTSNTSQIVEQIDNTQSTIEQTIQQMENIAEDTGSATPTPTAVPEQPTSTPIPTTPPPTATPTTATKAQELKDKLKTWCENNPVACEHNKQKNQEE